jgi:hypothetical protein
MAIAARPPPHTLHTAPEIPRLRQCHEQGHVVGHQGRGSEPTWIRAVSLTQGVYSVAVIGRCEEKGVVLGAALEEMRQRSWHSPTGRPVRGTSAHAAELPSGYRVACCSSWTWCSAPRFRRLDWRTIVVESLRGNICAIGPGNSPPIDKKLLKIVFVFYRLKDVPNEPWLTINNTLCTIIKFEFDFRCR